MKNPLLENGKALSESFDELMTILEKPVRDLYLGGIVSGLRNLGCDLQCGAYAALFFTGYGGYEHECGIKQPETYIGPP